MGGYSLTLPSGWKASYEQTGFTYDGAPLTHLLAADEPGVMNVELQPNGSDSKPCSLSLRVNIEGGLLIVNPSATKQMMDAVLPKLAPDEVAESVRWPRKL